MVIPVQDRTPIVTITTLIVAVRFITVHITVQLKVIALAGIRPVGTTLTIVGTGGKTKREKPF